MQTQLLAEEKGECSANTIIIAAGAWQCEARHLIEQKFPLRLPHYIHHSTDSLSKLCERLNARASLGLAPDLVLVVRAGYGNHICSPESPVYGDQLGAWLRQYPGHRQVIFVGPKEMLPNPASSAYADWRASGVVVSAYPLK